jgi:hydroxylamine reductase (hybrid-cluster protein)
MSQSLAESSKKKFHDEKQFIDTRAVRDLLCYIARGIAPYADAMRRFGVTDKDIDIFVSEVLASAGSAHHLPMKTVDRYANKAKEMQNRAKTLVEWAALAYGRAAKPIDHILDFECLLGDVLDVSARIREDRQARLSDKKVRSWYELCETRIKAFASIVVSSISITATDYDAYGFIHKALLGLSGDRSLFELAALSQLIEKEMLRLVNLSVSGDTLVDLPKIGGPVRTSRIVSINPEPVSRVTRDRV